MKKILLLVFIGLIVAGAADASLTRTTGEQVDCRNIDMDTCYKNIDCTGYKNYSAKETNIIGIYTGCSKPIVFVAEPTTTIQINTDPIEPVPTSCLSGQILDGTKCVIASTYCRDKFGIYAQYDEIKKDCACQPRYEFKTNTGVTSCVAAKIVPVAPIIETPKAETPAPVVIPTAKTPIPAPIIPKAEPVVIKDVINPAEPVLETTTSEEISTSSESVQSAPQVETVTEPAAVAPVIIPETKEEPNFIFRFFQAISAWFGGLWK